MVRVTVWGENVHERTEDQVRERYPDGHARRDRRRAAANCSAIRSRLEPRRSTSPSTGSRRTSSTRTDVLTWWGHIAHDEVDDAIVARVHDAVLGGMGLLVLHSGHYSKILKRVLGTSCSLRWRNEGERELVWTVNPAHPIAAGVPHPIVIPAQEMYGEHFDIPEPDELVFISSFAGGEVFRSGCCFQRGAGRIFYFSPGDQDYPVYHQPEIQRVLANAVQWAAPRVRGPVPEAPNAPRDWFLTPPSR